MRTPKLQRWIDLLTALLRRSYPVTLDQLVAEVPGYQGNQKKETLRRMFERDKDELRAFGVPIETLPPNDHDESGYRLDRRSFYMPYLTLVEDGRRTRPRKVDQWGYRALTELTFDPDELAAVVRAADRVRQLGDPLLTDHADSALRKLAVDLPVDGARRDTERIAPVKAGVTPEVLDALGDALADRKRVTVEYRSMSSDVAGPRTLHPYGLFFLGQHWYLAAAAPDDPTVKNYRLSRIGSVAKSSAKPGTPDYVIPADFRIREHARSRHAWELGDGDAREAIVEFRRGGGAVRAASRLGAPVPGSPDRRQFLVRRPDSFARWLLSFGGDAEPVSPAELVERFRVIARETLAVYVPEGRP